MNDSPRLGLPMLAAAQAQKHVTVNEAFVLIDGITQMSLKSASVTAPPTAPADGDTYGVPQGASGSWATYAGQVAIFSNGGWVFIVPRRGWRAFVEDADLWAAFDGTGWSPEHAAVSVGGASTALTVIEFDHVVSAGTTQLTSVQIPANMMVFGVTGRVKSAITGTLSGWSLGNPGAPGRYGTGFGLAAGSYVMGLLGQPMAFYNATPLELAATGGSFGGGTVRLCIHGLTLGLPR